MYSRRTCAFLSLVFTFAAVRVHAQKMYWTDALGVRRANLDGTAPEIFLPRNDLTYSPIAIEPHESKLYWSSPYSIYRSNLDGSDVHHVLDADDRSPIAEMAIDWDDGKIYWLTYGKIARANLDGSDQEVVHESEGIVHFAVDVRHNLVFFIVDPSDPWSPITPKIQWISTEGGEVHDFVEPAHSAAIAIDSTQGIVFWHSNHGDVMAADVDGTDMHVVDPWPAFVGVLDESCQQKYWFDWTTFTIQRANYDGSDVETIVTPGSSPSYFPPTEIAVLPCSEQILWTYADRRIVRANFHDTDRALVFTGVLPDQFSLDTLHGMAYWATAAAPACDSGDPDPELHRSETHGGHVENLFSRQCEPAVSQPFFDVAQQKMYWVANGVVVQSNLDGSNRFPVTESCAVQGLHFLLDLLHRRIYWANYDDADSAVSLWRMNLDGSDRIKLFTLPPTAWLGALALDAASGLLFWSEVGSVGNGVHS